MISSLWHNSKYNSKFNFELKKKTSQTKYKSKLNFEFFGKKSDFYGSMFEKNSREDLSIDVSITNVGLILTKPGRFFSRRTETRGTDRIQFRRFRTF